MNLEFWLSIIFGILLVIQIQRRAKEQELLEKTIILLEYYVDENTKRNKKLTDLLLSKLPQLPPEIIAEVEKLRAAENKE